MPAVQPDLQPLLTTSEIAHILGCHPSAVVRWIQRGTVLSDDTRLRLEAIATPGGWRVHRSALDAYLARLTADRKGAPIPAASTSANSIRTERLDAALQAAGFSICT